MLKLQLEKERAFREFFGKQLRDARLAANLSQKGLAYRLQIGQDTISNYECGKVIPDIFTVFQLALILGLDVRHFFPDSIQSSSEENR